MHKTAGRRMLEALIAGDEEGASALFSSLMRAAAVRTFGLSESAGSPPLWLEEALAHLRSKFKRVPDAIPDDGYWVPNDRGRRMLHTLRDALGWTASTERRYDPRRPGDGEVILASPPGDPSVGLAFTLTHIDDDDGETRIEARL